jgi:AraC family transcriptional regulator
MIYSRFPDLEWLRRQAEMRFSNRIGWQGRVLEKTGWPTVVLNVDASEVYRDNIQGPLSIFTNLSGESTVEADSRRVTVKEGFYFVTNRDQRYTLSIDKKRATTFNIHFGENFAEEAFSALRGKVDSLVDQDGFISPVVHTHFYNSLRRKDPAFNNAIEQIRQSANEKLLLDEKLFDLMQLLLQDHEEIKKATQQIPSVKKSTRGEIVKRLLFSTDYIHTFYDRDLSLDELARESCLSKFHFLRLFKITFGKTPYQFVAEVRAEKAKSLLKNSSTEVSVIAKSLGFKDSSSFSRMFFTQVGVYPSQFRAAV